NRDRAAAGLVPALLDPRLASIARARSADMATYGYFAHTQPNGLKVFDILTATGIAWYGAGEILASNNYATLADSATAANDGWIASSGHRGIILAPDYNYVGVGVAA